MAAARKLSNVVMKMSSLIENDITHGSVRQPDRQDEKCSGRTFHQAAKGKAGMKTRIMAK
jgi:hypothetical protein